MKKCKPIVWLLALVLAFALLGCGGSGDPDKDPKPPVSDFVGGNYTKAPTGKPDYSAFEGVTIPIGAWNPGPGGVNHVYTEGELAAAKEAGIQFLCDLRPVKYTSGKALTQNLDRIEKAGLKTFINFSGASYSDLSDDSIAYSVLKDYIDKDYILGFNFWDEPPKTMFDRLQGDAADFIKDHPDKLAYVNLLPNYASTGQLGTETYQDYVDSFAQTATAATHLSYDFYPLAGKMYGEDVSDPALNNLWLSSLETMSNAAKRAGKDFWVFIQCMDFNQTNRAPQSKEDITFQNFVNMCYGARGLQYFSFTTPPDGAETFGDAMLDRNLNKTKNYDYVKAANELVQSFAHVYMQYEWDNVMPVEGTLLSNLLNTGFDMLTTCMTSSDDFAVTSNVDSLVGQFHDSNGYKAYMVTNINDPIANVMSTVTMTFNANRVLVYGDGQCTVVEIPTGEYKFKINSGEGRFIIPFNV